MSVTANWHLDGLDDDDGGDPLQQMTAMLQQAEKIDVTRESEAIESDLQRMLAKEARWAKSGVSCELKWEDRHLLMGGTEASCRYCPVKSKDPNEPMTAFCKMACDQERLTMELSATSAEEALDQELCLAMARDVDEADELAELALA